MDRTERVELTALCLVRRGNEILLQNRVKADWHGYALPGGHVEPGESIVDAVVREIREETGLRILSPKLCGIKQFPIAGGRYLVFLFRTDQFEGSLTSSEGGTVEWIDRDRLSDYPTVEDLDVLLRVFDEDMLTEFQYVCQGETWEIVLR